MLASGWNLIASTIIDIVEALRLTKNLSLRRMISMPSDEPVYRPTFFDGTGSAKTVEQATTIIGRKAMKSFLENTLHQTAGNTDELLRRLDEERGVNAAVSWKRVWRTAWVSLFVALNGLAQMPNPEAVLFSNRVL
jgi:hypothetical protein